MTFSASRKIILFILAVFCALLPSLSLADETSNTNSTHTNGVNQYWSIADASQTGLNFSNTLTIAMWVKFDDVDVVQQLAIKRKGTTGSREYHWYYTGADQLTFVTWTDGSTPACNQTVSWAPTVGTWYHLAVTKSGTSMKFYVNGAQQGATQTCGSSTIYDGTAPFEIGGWLDDSQYSDAIFDSVMAYDIELSAANLTAIYSDTCTQLGTPVSWWQFNGDGTDAIGTNDLTAQNSVAATETDVPYTCGGDSGSSTTTSATTTLINNPNQDLFNGLVLFFGVFWFVVWFFKRPYDNQ